MHPEFKGILAHLDATNEELAEAWSKAISVALGNHKQAGVPVATWDETNHRVLLISPEELPMSSDVALEVTTSKTPI